MPYHTAAKAAAEEITAEQIAKMPMLALFSKERHRQRRAEMMQHARDLRQALTDRGYSPDDERVKRAVGKWVARARRSHAIAMGRESVIEKLVFVDGDHRVGAVMPVYAA